MFEDKADDFFFWFQMKLTYWAGMMDGQSSGNVLEFSGTGHKSKTILLKWIRRYRVFYGFALWSKHYEEAKNVQVRNPLMRYWLNTLNSVIML